MEKSMIIPNGIELISAPSPKWEPGALALIDYTAPDGEVLTRRTAARCHATRGWYDITDTLTYVPDEHVSKVVLQKLVDESARVVPADAVVLPETDPVIGKGRWKSALLRHYAAAIRQNHLSAAMYVDLIADAVDAAAQR